ncbi:MAG: hypothetical protein HY538_04995 [Deltaproteobacteria bacterium]|nr:hypothetical protein [Deltaproteobacteria bacterium]
MTNRSLEIREFFHRSPRVERFSCSDFKEQVLPFLPEEMIRWYEDPQPFEKLKEKVQERLTFHFIAL